MPAVRLYLRALVFPVVKCFSIDRGVDQVADAVEPGGMPRVGRDEIGDVGEGHARTRIGPAIGAADTAMAKGLRRCEQAEAADAVAIAARMRTQPAMHR